MMDILMNLVPLVVVGYVVAYGIRWIITTKYEKCYSKMESAGYACFGSCGGKIGGDINTHYLDYDCIDCPYFVSTIDGKGVWTK